MNAVDREEPAYILQPPAPDSVVPVLHWRAWFWLGVPLLALLAYATVLWIGFLSDDFVLLYQAQQIGLSPSVFVPQPHFYLYRPLGMMLVWQVGWQLWGFNPLPYHILSLLLHAGASLLLGLWLFLVTGRRSMSWLAGALFAVFPLHLEAVGWLSAQWDTMAVFFILLSLVLFTAWWLLTVKPTWLAYWAAVLFYGAAIFTKESTLAFLPVFALSAWLTVRQLSRYVLRKIVVALLPFAGFLGLNFGLRLAYWGHLGGYGNQPFNVADVLAAIWDKAVLDIGILISPLNSTLLGPIATQMVGLCISALLVVGLVLCGSLCRRVLLVAGSWLILGLAPVISLPVARVDLQNNRYLYLATCGYCIIVAALASTALSQVHAGSARLAAFAAPLVASAVLTWAQLSPWLVATQQVDDIEGQVGRLVPPERGRTTVDWYVENLPDNYDGAYLLRLGMGGTRHFVSGYHMPIVHSIPNVSDAPFAKVKGDVFALRFSTGNSGFYANFGGGISNVAANSALGSLTNDSQSISWDFAQCEQGASSGWQLVRGGTSCLPGQGTVVSPNSDDPQLLIAGVRVPAGTSPPRYVRLGAEVRYAPTAATGTYVAQWFWRSEGSGFIEGRSVVLPLRGDDRWYDYWAFVPYGETASSISALRFDPINARQPVELRWIELDAVP